MTKDGDAETRSRPPRRLSEMLRQAFPHLREVRTDPCCVGGPDSLRELVQRQTSGKQILAQCSDCQFTLGVRDTPQPFIQPSETLTHLKRNRRCLVGPLHRL